MYYLQRGRQSSGVFIRRVNHVKLEFDGLLSDSSHIMAGAAAKKADSRRRQALLQYGLAALIANALFFTVRFCFGSGVGTSEWVLVALAEATLVASGWSLVSTAALMDALAASSLDYFGIACAALALASIWAKGWWILIGLPVYLVIQWGAFLKNMLGWGPKEAPVSEPTQQQAPASAGSKAPSRGKATTARR